VADIRIPKSEFLKEHKRLLKVLKSPGRQDDAAEYKEQSQELQKIMKDATGLRAIAASLRQF
jgi:preprotein translocase subunit Sss1